MWYIFLLLILHTVCNKCIVPSQVTQQKNRQYCFIIHQRFQNLSIDCPIYWSGMVALCLLTILHFILGCPECFSVLVRFLNPGLGSQVYILSGAMGSQRGTSESQGGAKESQGEPRGAKGSKYVFLTFPACFQTPLSFSNMISNCSNLLGTYEKLQ